MKIISCLVRVTWSKHTPETPDQGVEMNKKEKTPRKIRRAPAQRQSNSTTSYGLLALILGIFLVALLAALCGMAAAVARLTVTSKTTEAPAATEAPAQPQNFCGQARDLGPWAPTSDGIGETFEVTATLDDSIGIVLGLWFPDGNTPWGTKEITTFVEPGLSIEVQAGAGRGFDYPVGCTSSEVDSQLADHMVQRKLDTNYNGYVDVDELIRLGLVVVRFDRRGQ